MSKAAKWLESIGLGRYSETFEKNDIGYDELSELTEDDLRSLGVTIGHMRRLLRAIKNTKPEHVPAERRQVTVLFADIVGFTNLSTKLDPEDLLDVINSFQTISTKLIEDYRGMVVKFVGDGLLAFFGWPVASERDAFNCVRAAKKLSEALSNEIDIAGEPLRIRAGIATGLAVVGDLASNMPDVFGDVPNLAARLQTQAQPGDVLISEGTYRLVNQVFDCEATGPMDVKGLGEIRAWSVLSEPESAVQTRLSTHTKTTSMHGREAELTELHTLWNETRKGNLRIVCLEGEAGLGKTRLASEFVADIRESASLFTLFGSPDAGQRPLRPIVELIGRSAGFVTSDTTEQRLGKLNALVAETGLDTNTSVDVLASICGLPSNLQSGSSTPERRRQTFFQSIKAIIESRAKRKPVVLFIEDLHWLDATTYELAGYLGGLDSNLPIFILSTTRPEQTPPWQAPNAAITLRLGPLSREHSASILQQTLGGGNDALSNVVSQILERADGIPLYLEELSQSVHMTLDNLAIPSTLQDSLMARLDRLGDEREIALVASILGRDIEQSLLIEVLARPPEAVLAGLDRLVSEQVLTKTDSVEEAETEYRFRHALLLEAAYDSQLLRKRRDVHAQVADVLIRWANSGKQTSPETIAHHLAKAKRPDEATVYYRQAGLAALMNAHYEDAETLFKKALFELSSAIEKAGEADADAKTAELEMKTELGSVLIAREGFAAPAVGEAFADAERIGRELGPGPGMARSLWGAWLFKLVSGDLPRALELSNELCGLGQAFAELDGNGLLTEGSWALGNTQFWVGDMENSIVSLRKATELYDAEGHADHALLYGQDPFVAAHCYIGYTESLRGHHSKSWAAQRAAIDHAKTVDHPFSTAWALCFPALIATFRREPWAARKLSEGALRHTSDQIMPFWQTAMTMVHGWSLAQAGDVEAGLAEAEAGLAIYDAIGSKTVQPYFRSLLADCLSLAGRPKDAADMLETGFSLARETGELLSEMMLHVRAGDLGPALGTPQDIIEQHLNKAIEISRTGGAASVEMDAAVVLAKTGASNALRALADAISHAPEPSKCRSGRQAIAILNDSSGNSAARA